MRAAPITSLTEMRDRRFNAALQILASMQSRGVIHSTEDQVTKSLELADELIARVYKPGE